MKVQVAIVGVILSALSTVAIAEEAPTSSTKQHSEKHTEVSREQREKMAAEHEKMAACLRSSRPLRECRREMMKRCHEMMEKHGCPMMDESNNNHEDSSNFP